MDVTSVRGRAETYGSGAAAADPGCQPHPGRSAFRGGEKGEVMGPLWVVAEAVWRRDADQPVLGAQGVSIGRESQVLTGQRAWD